MLGVLMSWERPPVSNTTRKPAPTPRRLESIATSAEYVGCNPRTIRRYIAAGKLTGYRMGPRLIRVDLGELDAILRPIPTAGGTR